MSGDASRRADALEDRVGELTAALECMGELLASERAALRGRSDADTLEQVARDKQHTVESIAELYQGLREDLEPFGEPGAGMAGTLAGLRHTHPDLAARVDRLVALTRECQQANQENGLMVSAGLRSASRALDSLRGPSMDDGTYDPAGRAARSAAQGFVALRA